MCRHGRAQISGSVSCACNIRCQPAQQCHATGIPQPCCALLMLACHSYLNSTNGTPLELQNPCKPTLHIAILSPDCPANFPFPNHAEEHQLRLKAEADALDKATRLQVAQEQLAEYASEKSQAAATVLQHAEAVEAALAALAAASSSSSSQVSGELLQQVAALKQQLADAALEAQAFSEQQQADVERLKRSSQQVRLPARVGAAANAGYRSQVMHRCIMMAESSSCIAAATKR